jgi:hypothetical protein
MSGTDIIFVSTVAMQSDNFSGTIEQIQSQAGTDSSPKQ